MVEIIYPNCGFKQILVVQAVRKFNQHNQKQNQSASLTEIIIAVIVFAGDCNGGG
jgi:hypothetical protein